MEGREGGWLTVRLQAHHKRIPEHELAQLASPGTIFGMYESPSICDQGGSVPGADDTRQAGSVGEAGGCGEIDQSGVHDLLRRSVRFFEFWERAEG